MTSDLLLALGGLGLFLIGMSIMTDGLRRLAGDALRSVLFKLTTTPLSGVAAGSILTAIFQSSSAITVTAVGLVGAGMLTFTQAVSIIFGANIGTTATAWIVALLGFKLKLGAAVLPLIPLGALANLIGRGRLAAAGWALAGFGLLFVGLDSMQAGMSALKDIVTPASFPADTLAGRLELVAVGIVITAVTQSSSAGLAAALAALAAGAITLPQAMAMVIGMNVGTTITAALATVGGSTAMRRTGLAHVIFNILSAVFALALIDVFTEFVAPRIGGEGDEQIALAGFHSAFNVLGVLVFLPFTHAFARLVIKLVPERGPMLTAPLDEGLLADPGAATDALCSAIRRMTAELFAIASSLLKGPAPTGEAYQRLAVVFEALEATRLYAEQMAGGPISGPPRVRYISAMHALDHLFRLAGRCRQTERIRALAWDRTLKRLTAVTRGCLESCLGNAETGAGEKRFDKLRSLLRRHHQRYRMRTIESARQHHYGTSAMMLRLDGMRWLARVAYHIWRISFHLAMIETSGKGMDVRPELLIDTEGD